MTEEEKAIRQRARGDADALENVRPPFAAALEVAQDTDEPDEALLDAVAALGQARAAEIYHDEWDAIEREAEGGGAAVKRHDLLGAMLIACGLAAAVGAGTYAILGWLAGSAP